MKVILPFIISKVGIPNMKRIKRNDYEVGFISQAHSESILDASVIGFCDALDAIFTVK